MQLFEHAQYNKSYDSYVHAQKLTQPSRFCISACKRFSDTVSFTFYNFVLVLVCKGKMLLIGELEGNNSCSSIVEIE